MARGCLAVVLAAAVACSRDQGAAEKASRVVPSAAVGGQQSSGEDAKRWVPFRTTSPQLALNNLDSALEARGKSFPRGRMSVPELEQYVVLLLQRARMTGRYTDFDAADAVSEFAVEKFPMRGKAHATRARFLSAVHRFDESLRAWERAEQLRHPQTALPRAWIRLALGAPLPELLAEARARVVGKPTAADWALLAAVQGAQGQFELADEHYQKAIDATLDSSPFGVCQLLFQRGVMWAEQAAKPERALPLYREAVRRLPQFATAQVHLAELEAEAGQMDSAVTRLLAVSEGTEDPEPSAVLSQWLRARDPQKAKRFEQRAAKGYEAFLQSHRAAFLDHGAEFFAEAGGDPRRALGLAQENFSLRRNARSAGLWVRTAGAAGDREQMCQALKAAQPWVESTPSLLKLVTERTPGCPGAR